MISSVTQASLFKTFVLPHLYKDLLQSGVMAYQRHRIEEFVDVASDSSTKQSTSRI